MRHIAAGAALILLALAGWLLFRGTDEIPLEMVPEDALALLGVNQMPPSLDSLVRVQLPEWIELDPDELVARLRTRLDPGALDLFDAHIRSAWFAAHRLSRKEDGSLRLHFSIHIRPRRGSRTALRQWILDRVHEEFEGESFQDEANDTTVVRGPEPGQVFHLADRDGFLVASNCADAWESLESVRRGETPRIRESRRFLNLSGHVSPRSDLFLYVRDLGLMPGFAYGLAFAPDETAAVSFYQLPEVELGRVPQP